MNYKQQMELQKLILFTPFLFILFNTQSNIKFVWNSEALLIVPLNLMYCIIHSNSAVQKIWHSKYIQYVSSLVRSDLMDEIWKTITKRKCFSLGVLKECSLRNRYIRFLCISVSLVKETFELVYEAVWKKGQTVPKLFFLQEISFLLPNLPNKCTLKILRGLYVGWCKDSEYEKILAKRIFFLSIQKESPHYTCLSTIAFICWQQQWNKEQHTFKVIIK